MTRKISAYGARLARQKAAGKKTSTSWATPIVFSRSFDESDILVSSAVKKIADDYNEKLKLSLQKIKDGSEPPTSTSAHDTIAHCLSVAQIRANEMGGDGADDVLDVLYEGVQALERCRNRWRAIGKWGFDGPAIQSLDAAAHIYEVILFGSTPLQMEHARMVRLEEIRKHKAAG